MGDYDFKIDINTGEAGEKIVIRDLESLGLKFISANKNNAYDLLMSNEDKEITYEIKTDVFIKPDMDTGNMFLEFECRGKNSGIKVSKAEWFVTYFHHLREIWYIRLSDLMTLLEENKIPITEFAGDGGSNTKGYLLPRYQYKNRFIVRRVPKEWLKNQN